MLCLRHDISLLRTDKALPAHVCCVVQEGTLRALSTLCSDRESSRRQLVEARAIGPIVRLLSDPNEEVGFPSAAQSKAGAGLNLVFCQSHRAVSLVLVHTVDG